MDVRQFQAFLAVAEHLHFGQAAAQLFMAQAPLSRAISGLEHELGARLFERSTRTVALTDAGQALIPAAHGVLAAVGRAEEAVAAVVNGEAGMLRVEFSGVLAHPIVAALARRFRAEHPGIRIELSSQTISRPAMDNLVNAKTDIALGRWDQLPPGISARVLLPDSLVVVLPRAHRLAGASTISFGEVVGEQFVSLPYTAGSVTTDRLWRLGYAYDATIDNVQFAPDTPSCIALVSAEVGCHLALASAGRRTDNPDVVFVPLDADDAARVPDVHLRVAWRTPSPAPVVRIALEYLNNEPTATTKDSLTPPAPLPAQQ